MLGPLPFLSPLREMCRVESSATQFQWMANGLKTASYTDALLKNRKTILETRFG